VSGTIDLFRRNAGFTDRSISPQSDGRIRFCLALAGGNLNFFTTTKFPIGRWYHVVALYDGTNVKIFVNGVLAGSTTTSDGALASSQGSTWVFDGQRNALGRIWSRGLTDAEAQALYFDNVAPRDDLEVEYLFATGSGATLYDTSGNGRNATITSGTWGTDVPMKARTAAGARRAVLRPTTPVARLAA
jgi:hypothetical protein